MEFAMGFIGGYVLALAVRCVLRWVRGKRCEREMKKLMTKTKAVYDDPSSAQDERVLVGAKLTKGVVWCDGISENKRGGAP